MSIELTVTPENDDDLAPLVARACDGDRAATEALMSRVSRRVRSWARRFIRDADDADDVAQEVLVDLGRRIQRYDRRRPFSTWLYAVTRHAARSWHRRDARHRLLAVAVVSEDRSAEPIDETGEAAALTALVLSYFDALPPKQRLIFELADLRGMSPAAIAVKLGMRPTTVRANLFKARASIRRQLLKHHESLIKDYRS